MLKYGSGGAVLAQILKSNHGALKLSALVRSPAHSEMVRKLEVEPILFRGLDELDTIKTSASEHDS